MDTPIPRDYELNDEAVASGDTRIIEARKLKLLTDIKEYLFILADEIAGLKPL